MKGCIYLHNSHGVKLWNWFSVELLIKGPIIRVIFFRISKWRNNSKKSGRPRMWTSLKRPLNCHFLGTGTIRHMTIIWFEKVWFEPKVTSPETKASSLNQPQFHAKIAKFNFGNFFENFLEKWVFEVSWRFDMLQAASINSNQFIGFDYLWIALIFWWRPKMIAILALNGTRYGDQYLCNLVLKWT